MEIEGLNFENQRRWGYLELPLDISAISAENYRHLEILMLKILVTIQ